MIDCEGVHSLSVNNDRLWGRHSLSVNNDRLRGSTQPLCLQWSTAREYTAFLSTVVDCEGVHSLSVNNGWLPGTHSLFVNNDRLRGSTQPFCQQLSTAREYESFWIMWRNAEHMHLISRWRVNSLLTMIRVVAYLPGMHASRYNWYPDSRSFIHERSQT